MCQIQCLCIEGISLTGPPGVVPHMGPPGHVVGGRGGGRHPYAQTPLENDRWLRAAPLPPVPAQIKMPQLHRAANRFEVTPDARGGIKSLDQQGIGNLHSQGADSDLKSMVAGQLGINCIALPSFPWPHVYK